MKPTIIDVLYTLSTITEDNKMPHILLKDPSRKKGSKRLRMSIQIPTSAFITDGISSTNLKGKMPDYFDVALFHDRKDQEICSYFTDYTDGNPDWEGRIYKNRVVQYFRNVPADEIEECIEFRGGVHKFCIETENSLTPDRALI